MTVVGRLRLASIMEPSLSRGRDASVKFSCSFVVGKLVEGRDAPLELGLCDVSGCGEDEGSKISRIPTAIRTAKPTAMTDRTRFLPR